MNGTTRRYAMDGNGRPIIPAYFELQSSALRHCEGILAASNKAALATKIGAAVSELGLQHFAYVTNLFTNTQVSRPLIIDNYTEEFRHFRYGGFFAKQDDPVRRHAQRRLPPLSWSSQGRVGGFNVPVPASAKHILGVAGEFEHRAGLSIPIIASGNRLAIATFTTNSTLDEKELVPLLGTVKVLSDSIHQASVRLTEAEMIAKPLTARELEVLSLLSLGNSAKRVAIALDLSPNTIRNYQDTIKKKLGVPSMTGAVRLAIDLQLI